MNWTSRKYNIFSLSAQNNQRLRQLVQETIADLSRSQKSFRDTCFASNINGSAFSHRLAVVGKSKEDVIKKLKKFHRQEEQAEVYHNRKFNSKIAFLFTGQGSLYPGMAKELYESAPVFKKELDLCDTLFSRYIDESLVRLLYGEGTGEEELNQAIYTQPIIFSIGYSLFKLWESWQIMPSVVMGHSIGEYAAACIAGVFPLQEAVKLAAVRGKIMHQLPDDGQMLGVLISEAKARDIIAPYSNSVSIAAVNSPQNVTLSGSKETLEKIIPVIKQERLFVEHLNISHPFHSIQMVPYIEKFRKEIGPITFSKPRIPVISTITGNTVHDEMCHADYWCTHIGKTVRFYDAVNAAGKQGIRVFMEIGGTATLCGLAADCLTGKDADCAFLPSLRKGNNAWRQLCSSLAQLYAAGAAINWQQFHQPYSHNVTTADQLIKNKTNINVNEEKIMEIEIRHENQEKRTETLQRQLKHLLVVIAGLDPGDIDENASLFSMGIDSLMVVQLRKKINKKYNVDIALNDFFTTYNSLKKISDFLIKRVPEQEPGPGAEPGPGPGLKTQQQAAETREDTPVKITVEEVIAKQLDLMKRQQQRMSEIMEKQLLVLEKPAGSMPGALDSHRSKAPEANGRQMNRTNPYWRSFKHEQDDLTAEQKEFIKTFTADYTARTKKSKAYAQANRRVLADWINSLNFRISLKELLYPIVSQRSEGAWFWDIDGNKYIDLSTGFGADYFGHGPGFVVEALEKQIKQGYELATQSNLAGKVAGLISRLANVERVVFSNTGTEAVMAAIRIARAVTGRKKILRFAGSFHGTFDGILAEADEYGTFPISPGTPPSMVADIIVLPYGSADSLEEIERLGPELAAVLVEPVQSRRPGFHPRKFLHRLREITSRTGAAFILDDIYMGFRIHQGGSQAYFGIEADIVTYGKVIGGGMPIGVVAGKAKFLDAIDGGYWSYGDDSYPTVQPTLFAGTFCRHPLTMAAAYAVLKHMDEQGPQLQEKLNQKAQHLVDALNQFFEEDHVPVRVKNFGSLFLFESFGSYDLAFQPIEMNLFFHRLIREGVYVWERRVCCLSTAHTDEDIKYVIKRVKDSIKELRKGGFSFSSLPGEGKEVKNKNKNEFSLTPAQQRYFVLNQIKELEKAAHLTMAMMIKGQLNKKKLESAVQEVVERHDIFRIGFQLEDGEMIQKLHDTVDLTIIYKKAHPSNRYDGLSSSLTAASAHKVDKIDEAIKELLQPFDLAGPPLIRIGVVEFSTDFFLLVLDSHHILTDGDSANILIQELIRLYQGKTLPPLGMGSVDYLIWWQDYLTTATFKAHEQFWIEKFSGSLPQLHLPTDFPRPVKKNFQGGLVQFRIQKKAAGALKQLARTCDATLFMILLAAYFILLNKLSGQEDFIVGIPVSIRSEKEFETITGFLTNNLLLRSQPVAHKTFTAFLEEIKADLMEAYPHKEYPYEMLIEKIELERDLSRNPLFDAMFIYENVNQRVLKIEDFTCTLYYFDTKVSLFDVTLEASEQDNYVDIKIFYSTALFKKETIEKWRDYYKQILADISANRDRPIKDILKDLKKEESMVTPRAKESREAAGKQDLRPPANEIEKKLIEIWENQLNIRDIGVGDNFFELGGRSFDTIRIVSRINSQLGTQIPLTAIFEYPTIAELAPQVAKTLPANTLNVNRKVSIPPAPARPCYQLSHEQMRYWLNAQFNSPIKDAVEVPGVEITADAFIFEGDLHLDRLKEALAEVVKRHDILRTTYEEQEGKPVQITGQYTDTGIPLEYCDLSAYPLDRQEEQLSLRLLEENNRKFNLKTGPLIRFFLYKISETKHILSGNAPHISFDGWSFSIILEEAAHFYNSLKTGKTTFSLPPVLRYVDYVQWHEQRITNGELEQQANYWTRYLTEKIPAAVLPYDYREEGEITDLEPPGIFQFILNSQLTGKLQKMAAGENTTLFVTTLAVLKTWIAIISNQTIITVGTIFSGRTYPELEKIPGIMMNLLPVRLNLSGNPDCRQILSQTKQVFLDVYNNQDYPIALVAHKMRKVINLNRDIYSIMFIGQEALTGNVHFDGLETRTCPLVNLIYGRNDKDDTFIDHDYNLQQDLLIEMLSENNLIKFIVRYNHRRFRRETIKQYFNRFKSITGQFVNSPALHLSQLKSPKEVELDELF